MGCMGVWVERLETRGPVTQQNRMHTENFARNINAHYSRQYHRFYFTILVNHLWIHTAKTPTNDENVYEDHNTMANVD